ncbi:RNA-binding protein with multiple splicing 2 [Glycine max]|nr:RNA-binding protein with multiple splicing 2 [Glycine max]KAH1267174.1 RNA-binding protein with multiple splicing 2 [Glycine max]
MAAYYSQPQPSDLLSYQYYQPPPPPLPPLMAVVPPPPGAVVQPAHHVHPSYMAQHQAVFASYGVSQSSTHEVRTLFVAGLPEDVKPREIYNLFREFPDYESSHLRSPSNSSQPFAFAVFASQQSAIMAKHALNGLVFDLEKGSILYIDLAKSNSRSKRTRIDDERAGADKKARGLTPSWATPDSVLGMLMGKKSSTPYVPQNSTPCATLFVANLGSSCNEQELIQVFSRYPGFLKLKMQSTYGAPVAFVDFQDVGSSTDALNSLQGTILHSSQSGEGMRVEYAKSRMGMRKKPNR